MSSRRCLAAGSHLVVGFGFALLTSRCAEKSTRDVGLVWSAAELPETVLINEVKTDPPGADGNFEFIELLGPAYKALDAYRLVAVEADVSSGNLGTIDTSIDLSAACDDGPCALGESGLLLLAAPSGHVPVQSTTPLATVSALEGGGLENGSLTLLLVLSMPSPPDPADWDIDDDCVLEPPTDATLSDGVAWLDADAGDCSYVPALTGARVSGAATRYAGEYCEVCSTAWLSGTLTGSAESVEYSTGQMLTPGGPNPARSTMPGPQASLGASGVGESPGNDLEAVGGAEGYPTASSPGDTGTRIMVVGGGTGRWSSPPVVGSSPEGGAGAGGSGTGAGEDEPRELPQMACGCHIPRSRRTPLPGVADIALAAATLLLFRQRASSSCALKRRGFRRPCQGEGVESPALCCGSDSATPWSSPLGSTESRYQAAEMMDTGCPIRNADLSRRIGSLGSCGLPTRGDVTPERLRCQRYRGHDQPGRACSARRDQVEQHQGRTATQ